MDVQRYQSDTRGAWNAFVDGSKNGTFLFRREYMEYHSNRFDDASLVIVDGSKIVALLPANRSGRTVTSHAGLSYGGFVTSAEMTTPKMLAIFDATRRFLLAEGVERVRYKCMPRIYCALPADEDAYALFRHGATLARRDVLTVVPRDGGTRWEERRRRGAKKGVAAGFTVRECDAFDDYWQVLRANLATRHETAPVHDEREIARLKELFPDAIRLFATFDGETLCGGVVVYESPRVAHVQYIASTAEGRERGCLDILFDRLLRETFASKPFFDFGTSTEADGRVLNEGLVAQKEGFGGRAVVHDHYDWPIAS